MVSFTGIAEIANEFTTDWLIKQATSFNSPKHTFVELVTEFKRHLSIEFSSYFPGHVPPLVITFAGWTDASSRHPSIYNLSNCENDDCTYRAPDYIFSLNRHSPKPNGTLVVVRGALPATFSADFRKSKKRLEKLIAQNSNKLDAAARRVMAEMITIASNDARGHTINDQVMASILSRRNGSIDYVHIPEKTDYALPGFVNENLSVRGLKVTGDFVEGGTTKVG